MIVSLERARDDALKAAAAELRAGGLIVTPTDTVYGLAADAFAKDATARIFALKQRPRSLPLPVLVARPRTAWALAASVPNAAVELAAAFWPGPMTIIIPAGEMDWDLGAADGTLAVRMPAHPDLLALLEEVGPLAVTSANRTGQPTSPYAEGCAAVFGAEVGVYLDGGRAPADTGSTIVDVTGPEPRVLRAGPIDAAAVQGALERAP